MQMFVAPGNRDIFTLTLILKGKANRSAQWLNQGLLGVREEARRGDFRLFSVSGAVEAPGRAPGAVPVRRTHSPQSVCRAVAG